MALLVYRDNNTSIFRWHIRFQLNITKDKLALYKSNDTYILTFSLDKYKNFLIL